MKRHAIIALALAGLVAGCAGTTESQQRAGTGALLGAAGGALVGQAIGKDTKATLIGAAAGGALGAVAGSATTPNRAPQQCLYRDQYGRDFTAPCQNAQY